MLDLCWTYVGPPHPPPTFIAHTATEALLIGIRAFEFELRFIPGWPYY